MPYREATPVNTSLRDAARHSGLFLLSAALVVLTSVALIVSPRVATSIVSSRSLSAPTAHAVATGSVQRASTVAQPIPPALRSAIVAAAPLRHSLHHNVSLTSSAIADPGATPGDQFGSSIAVSGSTALVGAWGATTSSGSQTGLVYVFTLQSGTWVLTQTLADPGASDGDTFGAAVALSGSTALIGAWGTNADAGAAYVFNQVGGVWTLSQTLTAATPTSGDNFGSAVALSGNYAAVGSWGAANDAGTVTLFSLGGSTWSMSQTMSDPLAASSDAFGSALSLSGSSLLIGAPGSLDSMGAAYFYGLSGATWSLVSSVADPDATTGDEFGASLALAGATGVVGAPGAANYAGEVVPFSLGNGAWTQGSVVADPNATAGDVFGAAVAFDGSTLAVGASGESVGTTTVATAAGAVYSFTNSANTWTMVSQTFDPLTTTAPANASGDSFGGAVGIAGSTLVAGAPGTASGAGSIATLAVPGAQVPIAITNTVLQATVGTTLTVALSGGSGVIAPVFSVSGANCSMASNQLSATAATSCTVTVTNPANGAYTATTSAPVTFTFTPATLTAQVPLVISAPSSAVSGSSVTLSTSGGSGVIAVTFSVTGTGCSIVNNLLTDSAVSSCTVSATNPANGAYDVVNATPVVVTFTAAPQAALVIANTALSGNVGSQISLTTTGGSGTIAVTYAVTGAGCSIAGTSLSASAAASCVVTATNPANGIYAAVASTPVTFNFSSAAPPSQATLSISNTTLSGTVGTPLTLTTSGGSGTIAVTYAVTGTGCSIAGSSLSASTTASCVVTATNPANGIYAVISSASVAFSFSLAHQAALSISNTTLSGTVGTPLTLTTSGGSGTIAVTYAVTGTGCSIAGSSLSASAAASCVVTATNPANGIYAAVSSTPVTFTFSLAPQAVLSITTASHTGNVGSPIALTTSGGSGTIAVTYIVTGTGCSITGSSLSASTAASCVVTATNPANGIYAAVSSVAVTFTFSLLSQAALTISNTALTGTAGTAVTLSATGGSGTKSYMYTVTGTGCSVSGASLTASTATSCAVTAHNPANGNYAAATSATVTFKFSLAAQATLTIATSPLSYARPTTASLKTSGGSGTGAVTYAISTKYSNTASASISGTTLTGAKAGYCYVVATKAASGIYASVTSAAVKFTFT